MEKILLLSEESEPDPDLIAWLDKLFPDCEIQIHFKETEKFGQYPASGFHFRLRKMHKGRHDNKDVSY